MKGFPLVPCLLALAVVSSALATPPVITLQPQDQKRNLASAADFSVAADNAQSYQWRLNGVNITDATNASVNIDNLTAADTSVDVIVTSPDGEPVTSRTAVLTIVKGTVVNLTIAGFADGSTSNIVIQLFDQDKPASVENFVHYLTSGVFSNMFFDRLLPNFVLQGGDYDAVAQTNATGLTVVSVDTSYVQTLLYGLPLSVDNEFNFGPLIHNTFGTLAFAKQSGDPDSAENGFFFNLGNNTTNLDVQNGGFTVFGRVVSGTEVLQYFNTFSKNGQGIYDQSLITPQPTFTDLPVNYDSFAVPRNTNLFYATFAFPNGHSTDSSAPTLAITAVNTNTSDIVITGTAADDVGFATIFTTIKNQKLVIFTSPLPKGTTNWISDAGVLPPGTNYVLDAQAQDGWGNRSPIISKTFSVPAFPLLVEVSGNGSGTAALTWNSTNTAATTITPESATGPTTVSGAILTAKTNGAFMLRAVPAKGSVFAGWAIGTNQFFTSSNVVYTSANGGTVTAMFVTSDLPAASLTITSPKANANLTNGLVTLTGKIKANVSGPQITCQIFAGAEQSALVFRESGVKGLLTQQPLPPNVGVGSFVTVSGCNYKDFNGTWPITIINSDFNEIAWAGTGSFLEVYDSTAIVKFYAASTPAAAATVNGLNWTVTIPSTLAPGAYVARAILTDANGNTQIVTENFEVLAQLVVVVNGGGTTSLKSKFVAVGKNYPITATPKAGQVFYDWFSSSFSGGTVNKPAISFSVNGATELIATFIANNLPKGFAITSPKAGGEVDETNFVVSGTLPSGDPITRVTCELYSNNVPAVDVNGSPIFVAATNITDSAWSANVSAVPGTYKLIAVAYDTAGRTRLVSQAMTVSLFRQVAGTYNGVFFDNTATPATSSGYLSVKVTTNGIATGTLRFPGVAAVLPLHFKFPLAGGAGLQGNFAGKPLTLILQLPFSDGSEAVTGSVSGSGWSAEVEADLAATSLVTNASPAPGNYVLNFTPQTNVLAIGYGFVTVSNNGGVTIIATMPDNTVFSESTTIGDSGYWPLYLTSTAYKLKGFVIASEQIANTNEVTSTNIAVWVKGASGGAYYPGGVGVQLVNTKGGVFTPPAQGAQFVMTVSGGGLTTPVTIPLTADGAGQFTSGSAAVSSISVTTTGRTAGAVTGTFVDPSSGGSSAFQGAFINTTLGGGGFVLENNGTTARFVIKAN